MVLAGSNPVACAKLTLRSLANLGDPSTHVTRLPRLLGISIKITIPLFSFSIISNIARDEIFISITQTSHIKNEL